MQFGVAAKPEVQARWQENRIKDDPKLPPWSTLAAGQAMKLGLDADSAIYYIGQPFALRSLALLHRHPLLACPDQRGMGLE